MALTVHSAFPPTGASISPPGAIVTNDPNGGLIISPGSIATSPRVAPSPLVAPSPQVAPSPVTRSLNLPLLQKLARVDADYLTARQRIYDDEEFRILGEFVGAATGGQKYLAGGLLIKFLERVGALPPVPNPDGSKTAEAYYRVQPFLPPWLDALARPIAEGKDASLPRQR